MKWLETFCSKKNILCAKDQSTMSIPKIEQNEADVVLTYERNYLKTCEPPALKILRLISQLMTI